MQIKTNFLIYLSKHNYVVGALKYRLNETENDYLNQWIRKKFQFHAQTCLFIFNIGHCCMLTIYFVGIMVSKDAF